MLTTIKRWLEPPHFAGDEEKTTQASVLNSLIINLAIVLFFAIVILVPFFVIQKIGAWILLTILLLGLMVGRVLINRGQLRSGTTLIISTSWLCFLFLALCSGGSNSPAMFYLASVTLIAGFVLKSRLSNALTLLTILIALGITFLQKQGLVLPIIFIFTPLTSWVAFGLGLVFMSNARKLFMRNLENALNQSRQENAVRLQIEKALRESESRFRSLIESSSEGVVLIDEQMKVIEWNPAQEKITGILHDEAIGTPYWDIQYRILPPERQAQRSPEYFQKAMMASFATGQIPLSGTSIEADIQTSTGERKSIFQVSFPIRTESGYRIGAVVRDITERKKAEYSIQSTTLRLTALLEHMRTGILFEDPSRHVALTNQAFCDLFGIPAPAITLIGADYRQAVQSAKQLMAYPEEFVERIETIFGDHQSVTNEELSLADGRTFERDSIPIAIGNQHSGHLWQYRDITERKRTEEAIRESEEKFRLSFMTGLDAFYIARLEDGLCIEANQVFEDIFGFTRDEIIGKTALQLNLYPDPDDRSRMIANLKSKGHLKDLELMSRKKSGEIITISLSVNKIQINNQEHILGVIRDITERKSMVEALQESEERFRALVQTANDAIITMDVNGTIVSWNSAAESIFGYTSEEVVGLPVDRIVLEQFSSLHQQGVEHALTSEENQTVGKTIEITGITKVGKEFPIEMSLAKWKTQAGQFFTAIMRDVSEREQREKELHAIASLSASLRTASTRTEMLAVIVKQLCRILNCVSISAEMIDPITNETVVEAAFGLWTSHIGYRQPPDTGLNEVIRKTRQSYYNNNIKEDPRIDFPLELLEQISAGAGVPLIAQDQLIGFLWMGRNQKIGESEIRLFAAVADIAANALHRTTLHERAQKDAADLALAYDTTLEGWAHALELRDQETVDHTQRVVKMTVDLARAMGIGDAELENVRRGALLHDIGKMGIPDSILLKPGTLNEREWEIMQRHPEYAYQFLEPIEYLRPVLDIPYCHHEKWDGSGYPRGLMGEEIPLKARIFAIVDVWDALLSDRPYRTAWTSERTRKYIIEQSDKHFDPLVVQAFLEVIGNG